MLDRLVEWIKSDPRGEKYRNLDWSDEYMAAKNDDKKSNETML